LPIQTSRELSCIVSVIWIKVSLLLSGSLSMKLKVRHIANGNTFLDVLIGSIMAMKMVERTTSANAETFERKIQRYERHFLEREGIFKMQGFLKKEK